MPARGSTKVQVLEKAGAAATGWVRVVSDQPLRGTSSYQLSSGGEIIREVGVGDAVPTGSASLFVSRQGAFDTALGIANLANHFAKPSLSYFDLFNPAGQQVADGFLFIDPQHHVGRFFHELVQIPPGDFEGTLLIHSLNNDAFIVTVLRTKDGTPISSYPVGSVLP